MVGIFASALLLQTPIVDLPPISAKHKLSFPVASAPLTHRRALTKQLWLSASADELAAGRIAGWQIAVHTLGEPTRNLLYYNPSHGPHPSQFDAWSLVGYWPPGARKLKVNGYPLMILAQCIDCRTSGTGAKSQFVSGKLAISWHAFR